MLDLADQGVRSACLRPDQEYAKADVSYPAHHGQLVLACDRLFNGGRHGRDAEARLSQSFQQGAVIDASDDVRAHLVAGEPGFDRLSEQ